MESKEFIKTPTAKNNGFLHLFINLALLAIFILIIVGLAHLDCMQRPVMEYNIIGDLIPPAMPKSAVVTEPTGWIALPIVLAVLFLFCYILHLAGFFIVQPNQSRVLTFFGKYSGTVKENGFMWMNPFYHKEKISLRASNMDVEPIKVNLYRQAEEYKRNIEYELRNYPGDWYYDSAHTEVAATLKYERQDSIDVAFDSLLWTTYYISNVGYEAGAAGGYFYEYHRTFSKKDGSLVDSTIFNPSEKKAIVSLLRKYAKKYDANPDAIHMDFKLEPSFLKNGIGFDGLSFEIGWHTHGSVTIVVPYKEILPYMEDWARREFGLTEGGGP